MAPLAQKSAAALLLLAGAASAQSNETVWSSFSFILYGERTPLRSQLPTSLTPYGAQQMLAQGQLFRDRYLSTTNVSDITLNFPIVGIEHNAIDNTQLAIFSSTDDFISGSATAFMQGLYPPAIQAFAYDNGGINSSVLANGSLVNYPLGGYQYPNIQTLSVLDPNSVWLEGHVACTEYWASSTDFLNDLNVQSTYNNSLDFYTHLFHDGIFANTLPMSLANYQFAYDLYDYAMYEYNHNETVAAGLQEGELNLLAELAGMQQFDLNGNLSVSGLHAGDEIRAIGGRTLAAKVVAQFQAHIASGGYADKLTLMFGSFEPMLAFFSLSSLSNGASSGLFQQIPNPGAAMVFELFSEGNDTSSYPLESELWVRFLYRNGTDQDAPLLEYPLFGNGNSQTRIHWTDFQMGINQIATADLASWCETCNAVNLFCSALTENTSSGTDTTIGSGSAGSTNMSPVIGGVIGAAVTLAVVGLLFAAAMVLGGFRIRRNEGPAGGAAADHKRNSSLGGFKGAEKLDGDRDVAVARTGVRHERVGSWEMGGPGRPATGLSKGADEAVMGSPQLRDLDDDDVSILGRTPVKPREGV